MKKLLIPLLAASVLALPATADASATGSRPSPALR